MLPSRSTRIMRWEIGWTTSVPRVRRWRWKCRRAMPRSRASEMAILLRARVGCRPQPEPRGASQSLSTPATRASTSTLASQIPAIQASRFHSGLSCSSMVPMQTDLAAEHPVCPTGVDQDDRDNDHRADQQEELTRLGSRGIPDGDGSRNDIRVNGDAQPDESEQEQTQREKKRQLFGATPQPPEEDDRGNEHEQGHLSRQENSRHRKPTAPVVVGQKRRRGADRDDRDEGCD